ncbi:hypothetical protein EX30DRAFT_362035 [Ascodesmis nigricans]|uniref:Uncharacterized protein n=1 Tax=Ascodesmis nigricans TaxID=341454 RepID=A0A4S2N4H1_9PEZI|nr:hypothetical protein EX30DRAFT_362035 [Ascodesmis nigricans]
MDPKPPTKDLSELLRILSSTTPLPTTTHPVPPPPASPFPDPRTITTLPAARRYIARHLTTSQPHLTQIRLLRTRQHAMEREWARSRADLVRRLEARRKLDGVLASLGVAPVTGVGVGGDGDGDGGGGGGGGGDDAGEDEEKMQREAEEELRKFDRKVMGRAEEMVAAMRRELGQMGVPGFVGVEMVGGERDRREIIEFLEDLAGGEEEGG